MLEVNSDNFGDIYRKMIAFFTAGDVESRVLRNPSDETPNGKGKNEGKVVAPVAFYVDARAVQNRLDWTVGPHNWKEETTLLPEGAVCLLSIKINGEWVTKSGVSEYTEIEGTKGGASKALVRAASTWGIGRYFYEIKNVWHPVVKRGKGWYLEGTPEIPSDYLP